MENNKVLLSVKDLVVKFRVRGRILTAIRGISLDIYENESIAIVGESGSGKSVFTKTFAGMLDENGFVDSGSIVFSDEELADTCVKKGKVDRMLVSGIRKRLNRYSKLELGSEAYREMVALKAERRDKLGLSGDEIEAIDEKIADLMFKRTEDFNLRQTIDPSKEKDRIKEVSKRISNYDSEIKKLRDEKAALAKWHRKEAKADVGYLRGFEKKMAALKLRYANEISGEVSGETLERNDVLAKEVYLSVGRYGFFKRIKLIRSLEKSLKKAWYMSELEKKGLV